MPRRFSKQREEFSKEAHALVERHLAAMSRHELDDGITNSSPELQREVLLILVGTNTKSPWQLAEVIGRLLRRRLPLTEPDLLQILDWVHPRFAPMGHVVSTIERFAAENELSPRLRGELEKLREVDVPYRDRATALRIEARIATVFANAPSILRPTKTSPIPPTPTTWSSS